MMRSRTKPVLVMFAAVFALGMLIILFAAVDKQQLAEIVRAFRPLPLLAAFGLFLLSVFLRGVRFRYMMNGSDSTLTWWRIAALHQFFFTVVPFRLGELSFFPLASRLSQGDFSSSLPVLLNSRLYDFLVLALFAAIAVMGLKIPEYGLLFLAMAAVIFVAAANTRFIFVVSRWIFEQLHILLKLELLKITGRRLHDAGAWYEENEKSKSAILGITLMAWLAAVLGFYLVFRSFSIELGAYQVLFLFAGMTFIGIMGFFSVGSIGVSELGLAGLLMVLGFQAQHALALGILTRLTMLAMTLATTALTEGVSWIRK
jgi:uncharacterized membrane protein YbhN (UPF0104 family)